MKFFAIGVCLLLTAALHPAEAAAQQRAERFASVTPVWERRPTELGPAPSAYAQPESARGASGLIAGGLAGLAVGGGIAYLLTRDETAGCDDGICGWVPPTVVGGATGLVVGGWIGYRVAVGRAAARDTVVATR